MTYNSYDNDLSGLESKVRRLEGLPSRLDDLAGTVESLRRNVDGLDGRHDELESRVGEVDEQTDGLATETALLSRRLAFLEDILRGVPDRNADLDSADTKTRALATTAETGRVLKAELLTDHAHTVKSDAVAAYQRTLAEHGYHRRVGIEAAETLATAAFGSSDYQHAETTLNNATQAMNTATDRLPRLAAAAERAGAELAADDRLRKRHAGAIEDGERAWQTLLVRLRTRVADAERAEQIPPRWFLEEFGPRPDHIARDLWFEATALAMAYRITYRVTTNTTALGPAPFEPVHRVDLYRQIRKAINAL